MTNDEFNELLGRIASQINEHADSVIILATRNDAGNTVGHKATRGNWYAITGQVNEFMACEDERVRSYMRKHD